MATVQTIAILRAVRERRLSVLNIAQDFGLSLHHSAKRPSNMIGGLASATSVRDCVWDVLIPLETSGLVAVHGTQQDDPASVFVEATELLGRIQNLLGISLTALGQELSGACLRVIPFHGRPEPPPNQGDAFVLSPFTEEMTDVYHHSIVSAVSACGLTCSRADDFFSGKTIMKEIWDAVCAAKVIIADCTGKNANVFYEIGLAHTLGKPTILLTQNVDDMPFDLRHIRCIQYSYTPAGVRKLENAVIAALTATLGLASTGTSTAAGASELGGSEALHRLEQELNTILSDGELRERARKILRRLGEEE